MSINATQLALQRKRYPHLSDEEFRFMLQQVDGRERTKEKLPTFANIADWWYPARLSCEQCSSELTARYKADLMLQIIHAPFTFTDLTGGYGVDTFFMSEAATEAHYVERQEELCRIVAHNFQDIRPQVHIHNTDAMHYLQDMAACDVIYIDPARRDKNGSKVFRLEDCEPNVVALLPTLTEKSKLLIIKLSPMLDITQALHSLSGKWDVHIVAVKNEVKEVLLLSHAQANWLVHAINLPTSKPFSFSRQEEQEAQCYCFSPVQQALTEPNNYLYEPNAAIIKAGAFKLVAERYNLCKMAPNTHLYLANHWVEDFPGRVWQIVESNVKDTTNISANIMTRNYPLTPEQLRKKLKIKDSDTHTIIGARLADKPTLFLCKKL